MKKLLLLIVTMSGITFADGQQKQVTEENSLGNQVELQHLGGEELTGGLYVKPPEQPELTYKPIKDKPETRIVVDMEKVREQREEKRLKEEKEQRDQREKEEQERLEREQADEQRLAEEQAELERIANEEQQQEQVTAVEQPEPEQTDVDQPESVVNVNNTLLAQIVHAEANGEPYSGKVAVAEVIINRTRSGEFPSSVEGVIYQTGQFSPVSDGSINNTPTQEDYAAVQEALNGTNYTGGAVYFYNPAIATSRWLDTLPVKVVIGSHHFK